MRSLTIPTFLILAGLYRTLYPVPCPVPEYQAGDVERMAALAQPATPKREAAYIRRHVEAIMLQQRATLGAKGAMTAYNDNEIRAIDRAMLRHYTPLRPILIDPGLNPRFKRAVVELAMARKLRIAHARGEYMDLSTVYPIPQEAVDRLWGPLATGYI